MITASLDWSQGLDLGVTKSRSPSFSRLPRSSFLFFGGAEVQSKGFQMLFKSAQQFCVDLLDIGTLHEMLEQLRKSEEITSYFGGLSHPFGKTWAEIVFSIRMLLTGVSLLYCVTKFP